MVRLSKRQKNKYEAMAYSLLFIQHFQTLCFCADSMLSQSL